MLKVTKTNLFLRENHNEKTNSFYLYFTGNENLGAKLRKDVAGELIQHINDYRQHPHLIAGIILATRGPRRRMHQNCVAPKLQ